MINREKRRIRVVVLALIVALPLVLPLAQHAAELKSEVGQYQGYSQPVYTEWTRVSEYGNCERWNKIGAGPFRPAQNKVPVTDRLPVIWTQQRYGRAFVRTENWLRSWIKNPGFRRLVQYGYVVGILDARGSGASYGNWPGPFFPREAKDAYDITEWFAGQPWCNGRVGMFGRSYMAVTQYLAAGTLPPHLKAIMPEMGTFDLYSSVYSDGVFRNDYVSNWGNCSAAWTVINTWHRSIQIRQV